LRLNLMFFKFKKDESLYLRQEDTGTDEFDISKNPSRSDDPKKRKRINNRELIKTLF